MHKIILFELNEVPLNIFNYYIKARPQSWLAKNHHSLTKYETISENAGHLSPWNTWPTVHRGVSNEKHYIAEFNQDLTDLDKEFPPIWQTLASNGVSVGVFGSLHTYPVPDSLENVAYYVPDVFSPNHECFPEDINLFQKINLNLSRKSARNIDTSLPYGDVLKAMLKIRTYGLTSKTVGSVAKQLVEEKIDPWKNVRRRSYQTVLSFDLFYKQLTSNKPDFTTFFTNHVASSLHRYWAALFPEEYEDLKYDAEWVSTYDNEIIFTMDQTDRMLAKLGKFVKKNPDYKLVITSSMGQEAVECEPVETELMLTDSARFMTMFGLSDNEYVTMPAMVPQYNYRVQQSSSEKLDELFGKTTINGSPIRYRKKDGNHYTIDLEFANPKSIEIKVDDETIPLENSGLEVVEIEDKSSATAYHIPEGHLYTFSAENLDQATPDPNQQVPTCDIAPMLLNNFGIKPAPYMNKTRVANF